MKLLITGDLVVNQPYNPAEMIDVSLIDLFAQSDINIVNLEAPVTNNISKILKTGPNIKSHHGPTLDVLKALEVDVATLANNHVLDYGEQGVGDTLKFCQSIGVKTVGAGMNLKEASQILYLDTKEGKIAIVDFAENEWASATETTAGAYPMDIIDNTRKIKEAKEQADYVFVIIHGGHEYYNLPSPRMQNQYRFYAEQGADIVVGHHTHCISGYETYNGIPIFYSLGNLLFTHDSVQPDWYKGLILELEISNKELKAKLHPIKQENSNFKLSLLQKDEKEEIERRVEKYSMTIADSDLIKKEWKSYVASMTKSYLNSWLPLAFIRSRYVFAILRRLPTKLINKKDLALYLNLLRCEAHRDMSEETMKNFIK